MKLNKYLIVLPCFPNDNGFNHQTVLVSAINEDEAKDKAKRLRPNSNIGEIKLVEYSPKNTVQSSSLKGRFMS